MKLNQNYYIEQRQNENHIDLNGEWSFLWLDEITDTISNLKCEYKTTIPTSLYHMLHKAGVLPDPYYSDNSKLYHWVDEKIWYYKKSFALNQNDFSGNALMVFHIIAVYG